MNIQIVVTSASMQQVVEVRRNWRQKSLESDERSYTVKSHGVIIDSRRYFDSHVRGVFIACNYQTRVLRRVRKYLTTGTAQTIAYSIFGSHIDYCNSLLYGAPVAGLDNLQRTQNNAARIVLVVSRKMYQDQAVIEIASLAASLTVASRFQPNS